MTKPLPEVIAQGKETLSDLQKIAALESEIEELKGEIRLLSGIADICVYETLKEICDHCRCGRSALTATKDPSTSEMK